MPLEQSYHAVILKKTPLNEADEIITFFSEEFGKVRGLAKSIKREKSKLQHSLQSLFLVKISLASKIRGSGKTGLRTIIRCEVLNSHSNTRSDFFAAKAGLYAAEAVFRSTPDEEKNEQVFLLLKKFLDFMDQPAIPEARILIALARFKLLLLKYLGHEISMPEKKGQKLYFSNSGGGFCYDSEALDRIEIQESVLDFAMSLMSFKNSGADKLDRAAALSGLLDNFLEYQIERRIIAKNF